MHGETASEIGGIGPVTASDALDQLQLLIDGEGAGECLVFVAGFDDMREEVGEGMFVGLWAVAVSVSRAVRCR
jgi:hypothetical protein